MNFINSKKIDCFGSSYIDKVNVSYQKLVETFGKESFGYSGDDKVSAEWNLKFEDGTIATIYDYKTNKKYCGKTGIHKTNNNDWHIGGCDINASILVKKALGL